MYIFEYHNHSHFFEVAIYCINFLRMINSLQGYLYKHFVSQFHLSLAVKPFANECYNRSLLYLVRV